MADDEDGQRDGNPAGAVRAEDAIDGAAVAAWLRAHLAATGSAPEVARDLDGDPEVRQFGGGASNLTYLLRWPARDLVLRRPPHGQKAASAHDVLREHRVQQALRPVFPLVPTMVAACDDHAVIGSDFYVMEAVAGTVVRTELPFALAPEEASVLCSRALDVLVDLHRVDVDGAGLADLGRGPGYVARQVAGWSDRYRRARTDDVPDLEDLMAWLDAQQPDDVAQCLVHGDFRLDNLVLDADDPLRVVGVLDWELATVGDPLMDLGSALAYWVQADDDEVFQAFRRQPTHVPGMWTRAEVVAAYAERTGLEITPERWAFYEVFGLFRLAVIAQQIYRRYVLGQTTNEAFAILGSAVTYLGARGRNLAGLTGRREG